MQSPRFPIVALSALFLCIGACGGDRPATDSQPAAAAGEASEYQWFLQQTTPGGSSTVARSGDGRITTESFVHWNNREYRTTSETQLDQDGFIVSQHITGTSPFGAPIDESFTFEDGVASWKTAGEQGVVQTPDPAFYVSNEFAALESVEALVRAAASRLDGAIPVLPSGSARVEKLTDASVDTPDGKRTLHLYSVSGLDFTPLFVWFDDSMRLAAVDFGGYIGMLPDGWDASVLGELSALQSEASHELLRGLSADLAHPLNVPLVIENVDVVDVSSGELHQRRHVLVDGGRITGVSPEPIAAEAALRLDATGKTLIPGLWDMHGHFGVAAGMLNIAGGVTSVRDIGGVHEKVIEMTTLHDSGEVIGPRTYRAGFIDAASPYSAGGVVASLDEALERVDFFAEHGYIQIKLYSSIDPEWVRPIAERAHAHGMRLSGHIPAFMSAEQAVRSGYDEIQHINMVFLNFLAGDREDTRKQLRFTLYGDEAGNLDLEGDEVRDFIELLKSNGVVVDPTAAIFETMLTHRAGEPDPTFAAVIEHLPVAVARPMYNPEMDIGEENVDAWAESSVAQAGMLRKLHESGVQLVPGSDNIAAFTLHRELEVYAEAGIPNADVLRIATLDAARVAGVADRSGSIEAGKDADLVLLDGNPLEDISAIRRATLVVKGATWYRPEDLYRAVGVEPFVGSETLN